MKKIVEMFTDGACRGNPGPGGWGVLIHYKDHERELFGGEMDTTNNRMELTAAIEGLRALKQTCRVNLYTDSQYVQKGISEWVASWQKRGWKTANKNAVKNADLWKALIVEADRHEVDWHWVKGHSGHHGNERADVLANLAIDEMLQNDLR